MRHHTDKQSGHGKWGAPTFLQDSHEVVQRLALHGEEVLHVEAFVLGPADRQVATVTGVEQVYHLQQTDADSVITEETEAGWHDRWYVRCFQRHTLLRTTQKIWHKRHELLRMTEENMTQTVTHDRENITQTTQTATHDRRKYDTHDTNCYARQRKYDTNNTNCYPRQKKKKWYKRHKLLRMTEKIWHKRHKLSRTTQKLLWTSYGITCRHRYCYWRHRRYRKQYEKYITNDKENTIKKSNK